VSRLHGLISSAGFGRFQWQRVLEASQLSSISTSAEGDHGESLSEMSVWQRAVSDWRCGSGSGSGHAHLCLSWQIEPPHLCLSWQIEPPHLRLSWPVVVVDMLSLKLESSEIDVVVFVGGDIDGRLKLLVVDLATSDQAIFLFIYFGWAGKVFGCQKKRTVVILVGKQI
jgi:hypothetical protein